MNKLAIVVGSAGQDGYYLSEQLRNSGYNTIGIEREKISGAPLDCNEWKSISDYDSVERLIEVSQPAEVYYLAAHHRSSEGDHENPLGDFERSFAVHVQSTLHFLEAIRRKSGSTKLFYAASSHVFGNPRVVPQNEETPFDPVSIYGITKASGVEVCRTFRRDHNLFCSAGILYNHESPKRGPTFIGQKIVKGAVSIKRGNSENLVLGDLRAAIDWGAASDYTMAMRAILNLETAGDFIIATGKIHSVGEFVDIVFETLGLDPRSYVSENPALLKKAEKSRQLIGDASKLMKLTDWRPTKSFEDLVRELVDSELATAK